MELVVEGVSKTYDDLLVLNQIDLYNLLNLARNKEMKYITRYF